MTVDGLIEELTKARANGNGDMEVRVVHASTGNPDQTVSGAFPLLAIDLNHGVNLVQSNYLADYVKAVFPEREA